MNKKKINEFFRRLDAKLNEPAVVILVGASAGSLMGHVRPSFDIDFEIRLKKSTPVKKTRLANVILKTAAETGVAVNFSENIGGGSMISYLDYRQTALRYKKFGKLDVKLIEPAYWTIGKMTRFLELDIQDMVKIIHKKKLKPTEMILVWAQAFRSSDLSLELGQFKEHVLFFLKQYSKRLWGQAMGSKNLEADFLAQISPKRTAKHRRAGRG